MKIKEKTLHTFFEYGIYIKAIDGILETIGGLFVLFVPYTTISSAISSFIGGELAEDPSDFIANWITHSIHISERIKILLILLLLTHGIAKIILAGGLIKNRKWAYPSALAIFSIFTLYQIYQLIVFYSLFLLLFTIFDVFLIWLIYHEYKYHQSFIDRE